MAGICPRCKESPATVWIIHQGRRVKVCAFCEIDIAINGW